ncbi:cytochrome c [Alteromonas sp. C1M14]|uniref:c-type cytochrome n=1 Tax=Alteromonas sp. C1M14 TaxID=2841567 RepID=UPI001C0811F1|nr:cytochrome c [Alteromonas sp. C1M14]MBU2978849.1 cytochrome c [Alteromonas sp. C1M14]
MKQLLKTGLMAAILSSTVASGAVLAQEAAMNEKHADAAVTYRQSIFQLIRSNMGPLGGMAKGAIPFDQAVLETNGMRLEQLANMMSDYLKVDTRKFDVDTAAKDEIWENWSEFEGKIDALKSASANLYQVAQAGDESQYRAAIGKVGAACKSCHDDFKAD